MTRDEIIEMARQAGGSEVDEVDPQCFIGCMAFAIPELERFAALVAAAEREAIHDEWSTRVQGDLEHGVKWMNEIAVENWHGSYRGMSGFSEWLTQRGEK
jgi:hypothetical protein